METITTSRNVTLSLCIPTFNRAVFLEQSLKALVESIRSVEEIRYEVEIVISDNVSTDLTQETCSAFRLKHPDLFWKIVRHENSVGSDNVQIVSQYASGEFIWILSDDDIVMVNAIPLLLLSIKVGFDMIVVNTTSFENDSKIRSNNRITQTNNIFTNSPSETLEFIGPMLAFLSIVCFKRSYIANAGYAFAYGSDLSQSYMFVDAIMSSKNIKFEPLPILTIRTNNLRDYGFFKVMGTNFYALLDYAESKGCSDSVIINIKKKHLKKFLIPNTIALKLSKMGTLTPDFRQFFALMGKHFRQGPIYWIILTLILISPPSLLTVLVKTRKSLLRFFHSESKRSP